MIQAYIFETLNYAIAFCCIYILVKKIYTKRKKKKFTLKPDIPYMIFGSYITALFSQTIMPIWHVFHTEGKLKLQISTYNARHLNLTPFKTIRGFWSGAYDFYGVASAEITMVNLLGNVCMFVPFGILFPLVFRKCSKFYQTLLCGVALSVFIEVMQYFVERSTDIDDVIINGIGVCVGYLIYVICKLIWSAVFKRK